MFVLKPIYERDNSVMHKMGARALIGVEYFADFDLFFTKRIYFF